MKNKDIQRCKLIIGFVFAIAMAYLLGSIGSDQLCVISREEYIRKGATAIALMLFALLTNQLLNKEVKKDAKRRNSRPYIERKRTDFNHAD